MISLCLGHEAGFEVGGECCQRAGKTLAWLNFAEKMNLAEVFLACLSVLACLEIPACAKGGGPGLSYQLAHMWGRKGTRES